VLSALSLRVGGAVDDGEGAPRPIRRSPEAPTAVVEGFLPPRHMRIGKPIRIVRWGCQKRYHANLDTRLDKL
jgi:hypothetical protein